jgi:hypothetical protein
MGVSAAVAGAAVAAFLSMGNAYADTDGYSDLFGAIGTPGYPTAAGLDNASLDTQLFDQNPGQALAFDQYVDTFESNNDHAVANLINALDPAAFVTQHDADITGTLLGGGYLVPDDSLGYLATELDAFLLNPTGLGFLLSPVIEILLGSPPF